MPNRTLLTDLENKTVLFLGKDLIEYIEYCKDINTEVYGCDENIEHELVYKKKLIDVHFPTDHFDIIIYSGSSLTKQNSDELFRILKQKEAKLIIDSRSKSTIDSLKKSGFIIIAHKQYFEAKKPEQERTKLLLPPGVGDVYWPLIKTESFLKREGIKAPVDAYVAAPRAKTHDSHLRAFPFLKMFPFLHSVDECKFSKGAIWKEAYLKQGRSIFKNILGCDYFITWNGYLRAGKTLEEIDPELKCNWYLPRFISLKEDAFKNNCKNKYGKYIALYWAFRGSNDLLLNQISLEELAASVNLIIEETGLTPLLIGAAWDCDDKKLDIFKGLLSDKVVDLRGQTDLEEVFGLLRGSEAVVGINSGITIMSAVFGVKTILLYSKFYTTRGVHRSFAWNTFPPDTREKTYFAYFADSVTGLEFASKAISFITESNYVPNEKKYNKFLNSTLESEHMSNQKQEEGWISIREITGELKENNKNKKMHIRQKVLNKKRKLFINKPTETRSIVCVLKSGGDFGKKEVDLLHHMVRNNTTLPCRFVCLTDLDIKENNYDIVKLRHNHKGLGWWSKIELFRPNLVPEDRIIYLDLDTVITGNIDYVLSLNDQFIGLKPWNRANRKEGQCASGMMSWINNGKYNFIYNMFRWDQVEQMNFGDQKYISDIMRRNSKKFIFFQDIVNGIYSYKRNCKNGLPENAKIVCFHGRPRPLKTDLQWVKKAYGYIQRG